MGGCGPGETQAQVRGWTSGSAANDLFFAATPALQTGEIASALVTLQVVATSSAAAIEVQRCYSLSNDGSTWDTPVAFTTDSGWVSALGFDYGTALQAIPTTKRLVRIGFQTNQKAATDIEQVLVNVLVNLVKR